jgi:site-specific recombinase XerD
MMLEELERRNYTESTTRAYIRTIEDFARYFKRPPDQLGPEQIRTYAAHLFRERKLTDNTVNQRVGALRFFFIKTLNITTLSAKDLASGPRRLRRTRRRPSK